MKEITVAEVKKLWRVKIGYIYMEENRLMAWRDFKALCMKNHWNLEQAYDYLLKFRWYHN